jgi:dTDP-4-amino-4,6-dideoxygalactose transaminase
MDNPAAANPIPFARPFLGAEEEDAVLRVLRSGWLTTGAETLAFEKEFAAFINEAGGGGFTAYAVNSATSGLHLALQASGVGQGDIVLVPSLTFTSTAEVARYLGADVAFVDVGKGSFLMDSGKLDETAERLASGKAAYPRGAGGTGPKGRPKAVVPVHYGGFPCDMDAINAVAAKRGLSVIEDAAHAFPARTQKGFAGALGGIGVFSFYATKTLATGEGGMVITKDAEKGARIALMRNHGIDRPVWSRYTDNRASWYYEVSAPGYKYNLPDILSAIGRVQLGRAELLLQMRRRIAALYTAAFKNDGRFTVPPGGEANAWHLYPLRITGELKMSRDDFAARLKNSGIGVSVHFIPLHTMPYYRNRYRLEDDYFPETMKAYTSEISLPIWPGMSDYDVERVISAVHSSSAVRV